MKRAFRFTTITLLLAVSNVSAATYYVSLGSTNPTPPYTNWVTAATNIQDAVDASVDGDQILVTNGVYQAGGRVVYGELTNRLAITKAVSVQSVNGRTVTAIQGNPVIGDTAIRCVYLTNYAALIGFTLTNGGTRSAGDTFLEQSGGAVWCESTNAIIQDCSIVSNLAQLYGGGAYQGQMEHRLHYVGLELADRLAITNIRHWAGPCLTDAVALGLLAEPRNIGAVVIPYE